MFPPSIHTYHPRHSHQQTRPCAYLVPHHDQNAAPNKIRLARPKLPHGGRGPTPTAADPGEAPAQDGRVAPDVDARGEEVKADVVAADAGQGAEEDQEVAPDGHAVEVGAPVGAEAHDVAAVAGEVPARHHGHAPEGPPRQERVPQVVHEPLQRLPRRPEDDARAPDETPGVDLDGRAHREARAAVEQRAPAAGVELDGAEVEAAAGEDVEEALDVVGGVERREVDGVADDDLVVGGGGGGGKRSG